MRKGIAVAGNLVLDTIYTIDHYPKIGELASISNDITRATGGAVCNVGVDLAKLDEKLQVTALGVLGADENGKYIEESLLRYPNIDLSQIAHEGTTSFTAVMSDIGTKQRTFFHSHGSNARFCEEHITWDRLNVDLLHIGYVMLLDELDKPDAEFGTKMARLLASAKERGIQTSIDVASDSEGRFKALMPPALKFTDYCIINELEAGFTTGISLRDDNGIIEEKIPEALHAIRDMGVSTWVVVHAAEGGYGLDCTSGEIINVKSLDLPDGYIKGTNGAGDAFCSGVLYAAYRGEALEKAIELGIGCAACSLSEPGATEGMRSYEEVLWLYNNLK